MSSKKYASDFVFCFFRTECKWGFVNLCTLSFRWIARPKIQTCLFSKLFKNNKQPVWPEVVFYHQSGVLGHLCGAEILAVVFSLKRVTFQFWPVIFIKKGDFSNIFHFLWLRNAQNATLCQHFLHKITQFSNYRIIFKCSLKIST